MTTPMKDDKPMEQVHLEWVCIVMDARSGAFNHMAVIGWTPEGNPLVENTGGLEDVSTMGLPWRAYVIDMAGLRAGVQAAMLADLE